MLIYLVSTFTILFFQVIKKRKAELFQKTNEKENTTTENKETGKSNQYYFYHLIYIFVRY